MTNRCFLLLTLLFSFPLRALPASSPPLSNGVYVAAIAWKGGPITNTPFRFDAELVWMPFHDSGEVKLLYPLDPSYLVKIRMLDDEGKEVPKFKDTRLQPISAWGPYTNNPALGGGNLLSSPKDLFEMKKPGIYTMEIEMQLFRQIPATNAAWSEHILLFCDSPQFRSKLKSPKTRNLSRGRIETIRSTSDAA
jgi:hypothetical protein